MVCELYVNKNTEIIKGITYAQKKKKSLQKKLVTEIALGEEMGLEGKLTLHHKHHCMPFEF